jgi:mitofusin
VLELLHKGVEERCFIAFPAVDNAGDTHPLSSPDEQLYVLKTYPILDSDQPYIPMPDEIRNTVLSQSLNSAQEYIKRMEDRAKDDYYHIMVVGDINSGKSAFINGLLRRDILPSGGRSLTSTFVEVLDAQDLDGNEEVHLCRRGVEYDRENEDTFERVDMANLYDIMCDWHEEQYDTMYDIIKVYVDHRRIDDNFLGNIERKIHIIDSVGLNTNPDAIRFLFEKQQEIDVLILTINATYGLTKSSTHIMKNYCEKRTKLFVVVTHPDCVCVCNDECIRSCEERRKQKFKNVIEEISPETAASADELIHYVNPTLVPMWDNESGSVVGEIPPEWSNMEDCLRTFICGQFEFHKLSPIVNYLQKVTHDVTLLSKLNLNMLESRFDEKTEEIIQLQDSISQLETRYDEVYLEARDIINKTITDIQRAVLKVVNDLKDNPEELVNREMIDCMGPGITADELQRLLQEKWKELEELYKQPVQMRLSNLLKVFQKIQQMYALLRLN